MLYLCREKGGGVQSKVGIMQARDSTSAFPPLSYTSVNLIQMHGVFTNEDDVKHYKGRNPFAVKGASQIN